jgi:hypothetical protein
MGLSCPGKGVPGSPTGTNGIPERMKSPLSSNTHEATEERESSVPARRILFGVAVGFTVAALVWIGHAPPAARTDFDATGIASQSMLRGENPYAAARAAIASGRLQYPLFYPATAPVLVLPLAWLPFRALIAVWTGLGVGLLAGSLTGWRRWILLSAPAMHAVLLGQWSPWLVAAVGFPWLGLAWAAKPSIGLAYFVGWPSKHAVIAGGALLLLSLLVVPSWPHDWIATIRGQPYYRAPVVRPFGFLLLLGFLRWRTAEGRFLGMLALVPHTTVLHETLGVLLCARTPRGLAFLQVLGYAAMYLVYTHTHYGPSDPAEMLAEQWPYLLVLCYLPGLVMVLARREGQEGEPACIG